MQRKPLTLKAPGADYEIRIVGARPTPLRDFYHALLQLPWWATIAAISAAFLLANALFAVVYMALGGVTNAAAGSFRDAFFFSVQTMGTIGYGAMTPSSTGANVVVVVESVVSLLLTALSTGLVFAKFSRSTARFVFTRQAVVGLVDDAPALSFRLGNERGNQVVDARISVVMYRTERSASGAPRYRMLDLKLARERVPSLSRSWNVVHQIDEQSPLLGETARSVIDKEIELHVMVVGIDDITMQTIYASYRYFAADIRWDARHADVISETPEGHLLLDLRRFHDIEQP